MFKRISLFILTNILVMIVGSFVINLVIQWFGLGPVMGQKGINYQTLMVICLGWGMVGSFISLWMSKWMAKSAYGVEIVSANGPYAELVQTVHRLARKASISGMPEVGVYHSPEINAFATGATKNKSLVAVSTGLLEKMDKDEVEGVLGHEVAHIGNGDMVTMALVQGIVNAFVMFFSHLATIAIDNLLRKDDDEGGGLGFFARHFVYMGFQVLFGILAAPVVMGFSRWREYRADEGSAWLCGKDKMISALKALQRNYPQLSGPKEDSMAAFQISSKVSWAEIFSSHPTLEKRIKNLNKLNKI
ncbi:MAG: protease HtpX [Bdellovibrionales bacterium]|nr:protease HtpX [Bdellovibrionales bacterium]